MRSRFHAPITVLALLAVALTVAPAAGAASGGGTAAPSSSASGPAATKVRPSAVATWFGPGFYGRETACGQILTPEVVGVANRTLPCGTLVQVAYDGRTLTVPVLDRGPYSHGAAWDLTAGAASALRITETVRIATRVVGRTANTPTLGLPPAAEAATATGGALAG